MAGTSFTMDLGPMLSAVGRAIVEVADTQRLAEAIGETLVSGTQDRFEQGVAPDGTPWAPTLRGGQTLVDSGRLKNSIGYEASPSTVVVGASAEYAATHQFGATIEAKAAENLKFKIGDRWVSKPSVTIPARPIIGLSEADQSEVKSCVLRHVGAAFGK